MDLGASVLLGNGDGTFQTAAHYAVLEGPQGVAIGDLDGDSFPELVVANYYSGYLSVLPGNGDGTFQAAIHYYYAGGSQSVVVGDLDGDSDLDLALANAGYSCATVMLNSNVYATLSAAFTCTPSSGTVPFNTTMSVTLSNLDTLQTRRIAGRINVAIASGSSFSNWKSGWTNVGAGSSYVSSWTQAIPALGSVIGDNVFTLEAEDVTPVPYNQPPHPPAGDNDTSFCTVTGIAP